MHLKIGVNILILMNYLSGSKTNSLPRTLRLSKLEITYLLSLADAENIPEGSGNQEIVFTFL